MVPRIDKFVSLTDLFKFVKEIFFIPKSRLRAQEWEWIEVFIHFIFNRKFGEPGFKNDRTEVSGGGNVDHTLERLQEEYKNDRFATNSGCKIIEANENKVVCEMPISEGLLNALGGVMGGAIFTLADFAFAVASNLNGVPSVAVESNIRFYSATKGTKLIATCCTDKEGRTLGHYTVTVTDDLGKKIAGYTAIAFHNHK